jgi:hypothetical protein
VLAFAAEQYIVGLDMRQPPAAKIWDMEAKEPQRHPSAVLF